MDIFAILSLIGGLALFLYGMNVMGDGLTKVSGGKLEKILEKLTSNPIKAVLLGAGVTAVIQSSSATTVMVVGFVNAGIMQLGQAVTALGKYVPRAISVSRYGVFTSGWRTPTQSPRISSVIMSSMLGCFMRFHLVSIGQSNRPFLKYIIYLPNPRCVFA